VELLIGVSALAVPRELAFGRGFLERLDAGHPLSLSLYYILAGLWIAFTLVPCVPACERHFHSPWPPSEK
jgi:hypothetical protein